MNISGVAPHIMHTFYLTKNDTTLERYPQVLRVRQRFADGGLDPFGDFHLKILVALRCEASMSDFASR